MFSSPTQTPAGSPHFDPDPVPDPEWPPNIPREQSAHLFRTDPAKPKHLHDPASASKTPRHRGDIGYPKRAPQQDRLCLIGNGIGIEGKG